MGEFLAPVDIGNRALQHCGSALMDTTLGFAEPSKRARQIASCYGKLRRAELQRNVWRFSTVSACIRPIDTNTMLLKPTLWSSVVTYFFGSVVEDQSGTLWESTARDNIGNQPGSAIGWIPYFGPMTAEPFDSSKAYWSGELIYTLKGDGTYNVFKSLISGNAVHPALSNQWSVNTIYKTDDVVQVFPAYNAGTTYSKGQSVLYTDGNVYSSLVDSNTGHTPPSSGSFWALMPMLTLTSQLMPTSSFPAPVNLPTTPIDEWNITQTYSIGGFVLYNATVYLSLTNSNSGNNPATSSSNWVACTGGTTYMSMVDLNQGNAPATSPTQWTTTFTLGGGNSLWLQIGGSAFPNGVGLSALVVNYPVGSGPFSQTWSRNLYRLPSGYLRRVPQFPSAGRSSWLGFPGNMQDTDWEFSGSYLVTKDSNPIVLRFGADVQDVTTFDDLFCEGLACRIALEVAEPLTQSTSKLGVIAKMYEKFMTEARTVGGIETRADEPPLDDFIATRV